MIIERLIPNFSLHSPEMHWTIIIECNLSAVGNINPSESKDLINENIKKSLSKC